MPKEANNKEAAKKQVDPSVQAMLDDFDNMERKVVVEDYDGEKIEHIYAKEKIPATPEELAAMPVEERGKYGPAPAINQRVYNPEPGIICMQDVETVMSDGRKMYSDIYRPDTDEKVPVIIAWSWFGKRPHEGMAENVIMGVPNGTVSTMAKFESPDPGYWCHQGYAVANADPCGCMRSDGDMTLHDWAYGMVGYEYIEWLAKQPWCSGKIGMAGNSGVAFSQWRIAQTQPPHLTCIAPWEATADFFREACFEGGIPAPGFNKGIVTKTTGKGWIDDYVSMMKNYPLMNNYWKSKMPKFENITIPAYICAGWSHFHLMGSINGFRKIKSRNKWLRCHRDFEWPDFYANENQEDLKKFFDRYLKGIRNGWEETPRVRLDVMDAYDFDYQHNRPENEFPLARTKYTKMYLDASNCGMSTEPLKDEAQVSYDSINGLVNFDYTFQEDTEITGYMKVHLWVEADGNDDLDMFFTVKKADAQGKWIPWNVLGEPHPGAWGKQRASMRHLSESESEDFYPVLSLDRVEKLKPGEIVPIDVCIWPSSRIWHKGERLRLEIAGRYIRKEGWFEPFSWDIINKGNHIIHTGGKYDSYFQIPVIPPKYRSGDYIVR